MEENNENHLQKNDLLVCDEVANQWYRTTREALDAAQEELTKIVERKHYLTYKDVLGIISEDWPEDLRNRFLGITEKPPGWFISDETEKVDPNLQQTIVTTEDGKTLIRYELN